MEFSGLSFNKNKNSENNQLNTNGLNKHVRHPLYSATLLIIWGYFLADASLVILIMSSVISIYLIIGTKLEEQKLIKEFGTQYIKYKQELPMLLPLIF